MSIQINSTQEFNDLMSQSKKMIIVDFWAPWCGPCKMIGPILDEIGKEFSDKVEIAKINVDEQQDLASKFGIMSIPTLILIKNGQLIDQSIGAATKDKLVSWIESSLNR